MSEQAIIPTKMLDAAAKAVVRYEANLHSCSLRLTEEFYGEMIESALRAAGVPALLKRIADAEQEMAKVREVLHDHSVYFEAELEKRVARIAELEAALSLAIPRMEHLQSLLSCGESVQFCNEFDEQKGKEVAEEVERLKRVIQNAPTGAGGE